MKYQQLTEGKRYQISALLEQGISVKNIALAVGCHRGSVYRELNRNTFEEETYCPQYAHQACVARKRNATKYQIPSERVEFIRLLIEHDWSPEQISGVLTGSGMPVSHEWIYQHIAEDKVNGGKLYRHLRQGHKRYRKGKRVKAEVIKNAVSIDDRPAIVDSRERFGDWEIDTVLGKHGTGAIVTLLERKSRFFLSFTSPIHTAHGSVEQMKMLMDYYVNMYRKGQTYERSMMMLYLLLWRGSIMGRRSV